MNKEFIEFSMALKDIIIKKGDNVVFSPFSIAMALAMLKEGADGRSLAELEKLAIDVLPYFRHLQQENGLKMANCLAVNDNPCVKAKKSFLDTLEMVYNAKLIKAPFNNTTLEEINEWAEKSTDGDIKAILDSLNEEDIAILLNSLSYERDWKHPFEESDVGIFYSNERQVIVEYLRQDLNSYFRSDRAQGFELELENSQLSFICILPNEPLAEYLKEFDYQEYTSLLNNRITSTVHSPIIVSISMPVFDIEHSCDIKKAIESLGVTSVFSKREADFSRGFDSPPTYNVYASKALQKCRLRVSQKGLKASAVTSITMTAFCCWDFTKRVYINLDRPFLFLLADKTSGLPLFMGTVYEP